MQKGLHMKSNHQERVITIQPINRVGLKRILDHFSKYNTTINTILESRYGDRIAHQQYLTSGITVDQQTKILESISDVTYRYKRISIDKMTVNTNVQPYSQRLYICHSISDISYLDQNLTLKVEFGTTFERQYVKLRVILQSDLPPTVMLTLSQWILSIHNGIEYFSSYPTIVDSMYNVNSTSIWPRSIVPFSNDQYNRSDLISKRHYMAKMHTRSSKAIFAITKLGSFIVDRDITPITYTTNLEQQNIFLAGEIVDKIFYVYDMQHPDSFYVERLSKLQDLLSSPMKIGEYTIMLTDIDSPNTVDDLFDILLDYQSDIMIIPNSGSYTDPVYFWPTSATLSIDVLIREDTLAIYDGLHLTDINTISVDDIDPSHIYRGRVVRIYGDRTYRILGDSMDISSVTELDYYNNYMLSPVNISANDAEIVHSAIDLLLTNIVDSVEDKQYLEIVGFPSHKYSASNEIQILITSSIPNSKLISRLEPRSAILTIGVDELSIPGISVVSRQKIGVPFLVYNVDEIPEMILYTKQSEILGPDQRQILHHNYVRIGSIYPTVDAAIFNAIADYRNKSVDIKRLILHNKHVSANMRKTLSGYPIYVWQPDNTLLFMTNNGDKIYSLDSKDRPEGIIMLGTDIVGIGIDKPKFIW